MARHLLETIEGYANAHLRDLARNPLLLSMIALVQFDLLEKQKDSEARLPTSRHALYARCVAMFVDEWNWDFARNVKHEPVDKTQYRDLLEQAALLLQKHQGVVAEEAAQVDRQHLVTHLEKCLPKFSPETTEACLQHSHQRTLLLVEQKLDSWGFQHKTFQEYLCAEAIANHPKTELDTLVSHLGEDHWRVVFELFVEG